MADPQERLSFGHWLKHRRKVLDLTQEGLAERTGCSYIAIHKIEAGTRRPSRQLAELLADFFKVPAEEREAFIAYARGLPTAESEARPPGYGSPSNEVAEPRRAAPASPIGKLPAAPNRIIGREEVVTRLSSMLLQEDTRLLTLTGPPGIGKTSLSLRVAAEMLPHFSDGVFFVPLAPISNPALVIATIATTLDIQVAGSLPIHDIVAQSLRDKRVLLVLDNFEQVLEAALDVAALIQSCACLKVLVTSRAALRLRGERRFPVSALGTGPSVELFVERARAADPDFELTEENAGAVTDICVALEGLPLALELAAARTRILSPAEIAAHLQDEGRERRLTLLAGGAHDLPVRQQTLRTAIDWSYALLSEGERKLFARLAVFRGGCSLPAAEVICNERGDLPFSLLDGLHSLFDKSLLKREEVFGESRYTMLEMIHEYSVEQLERSGEAEEVKRLHAEYYLLLAEAAASQIETPEQAIWLNRLESVHDNMRAALQWTQSAAGDPHLGLRLAVALAPFWTVRSHFHEARAWLARVIARSGDQEPTTLLAEAYARAGRLAFRQSDYAAARRYYDESLAICRELGDTRGVGIGLAGLGDVATEQGDVLEASAFYEMGLATFRELDDSLLLADCLVGAGWASMEQGNYTLATEYFEEALALCRRKENNEVAAWAMSGLGDVAVRQENYARAVALLEESLLLRQQIGDRWGMTNSLDTLAWAAVRQTDFARAKLLLKECILIRQGLGDRAGIALCLGRFAEIESRQGGLERAAMLYAAAQGLRQSVSSSAESLDRWSEHERNTAIVRARLDGARWEVAWASGLILSIEQAVAFAMEEKGLSG